ncbi:hypothetical protein GQ54DRAFT_295575 [Martensiomyces pterosporus]|nr:hypothetical protein GQ54DRAFT_295575 [Martensiomyces pterosporus]
MATAKPLQLCCSVGRDFDFDEEFYLSPLEMPGCIRTSTGIVGGDGSYTTGQPFTLESHDGIEYFKDSATHRYLAFSDSDDGDSTALVDEIPAKENRVRFHQDEEYPSLLTISRWNSNEMATIERTETGLGRIGFNKENPLLIFQLVAININ